MLAADLKKALDGYGKADLVLLATELYRKIPKKERDAQDLDGMILDFASFLEKKKLGKPSQPLVNITNLEIDVRWFLENAYNQYYMVPNRVVSKKDRPKWRFLANGFIKELNRHPVDGETGEMATGLLLNIYQMLCYATQYHLFVSTTPFKAVGLPQTEMFDMLIARMLEHDKSPERIRLCLRLLIENNLDEDTYFIQMTPLLYPRLKTPDMKETAIAQGFLLLKDLTEKQEKTSKAKHRDIMEEYNQNQAIDRMAHMLFDLLSFMGDVEHGLKLYKKYGSKMSGNVSTYAVLWHLEFNDLPRIWLREYDLAVSKGETFGPSLAEKRELVMRMGEFPTTD